MIKLNSQFKPLNSFTPGKLIAKITTNNDTPMPLRSSRILLVDSGTASNVAVSEGFAAILYKGNAVLQNSTKNFAPNSYLIPEDQWYLGDGDVLKISKETGHTRTLYRRLARQNSLLVTERCNSFCVMCSQPPKDIDDSYLVDELCQVIPLIDKSTTEVGFTGGEPTLLGENLIKLMRLCKNYLPSTALHILSNGRNFIDPKLAHSVSSVQHHDLMFGIPIYSDISSMHDYIVQADNAFDETIKGILNLKRFGVRVEIRVVIHQANYQRLPQLAEFLTRNLLFVDHVALMGLELIGFAKANVDALWIDPIEYKEILVDTVKILNTFRMRTSIYNHQLCLLDKKIWPFNVKSISDWKNEYYSECEQCTVREACGGFFSSGSLRISKNLKAISNQLSQDEPKLKIATVK